MTKFRKYLVAIFATLLAVAASAADMPYGTNLLQNTNPDGTTFDPWVKTDGGSGWAISDGKFLSSYQECVLTQTVNLKDLGLMTEQTDSLTMLSMVNYEILWPGNNKCIAKVIITCKDSDGNNLSEQSLLDINQSYIEVSATLATKLFLLPKGTTQLVYEVHGKSQMNWRGQYGPRFWSMYVGFADLTKTYTASAVAALGDSLVLSKTDGIKILDTVTVTSKYSDVRIKSISSENSIVISSNQAMCIGADMTINAEFYRRHSIVASSSEYGTITFKKDAAIYGDTITVSHTMNSYTVYFAGYTTTPDLNWLTDSTFVMVDEDVTIGMHTSTNLLQNTNPDGTTFDPWVKTDGGSGWAISDGKFCSSNRECVLMQTVNLKGLGLTTEQTDSLAMLSMVNYEIPWPGDNNCIAKVIITCKDSDGNNLSVQSLLDINQSNLEVSATLATKPFLLPEGTTQLVYEMHGQDQKSWGGQYGPRFWGMYVGFIDLTKTYTASAVAALGDSLVFSQTDGIKALDTLTVASKYSDVRIKSISSENSSVISSNQAMCIESDMTINAEFYRKHSIVASSSEYGTITFKKDAAFYGDTITVSHTMNSDTVRFAGYTTTPNVNWLNDSTFIMVDEDVTIGMEVYRKHRIVASSSEYGTITFKKDAALYGDTITVSHTMNSDTVRFAGYTTTPNVNWLNDSTFIMVDEDVTIGMEVYRKHRIVASSSVYGTIEIRKATALYGDTITVSHTMNSYTVYFAGYTTTPDLNWLTDSTFVMVDEDVTIGMHASTNLLQNTNPDGTTFDPWVKTDGGSGWAISDGKFLSSYQECVLTQTVNLKDLGLMTEQTDSLTMLSMVNYEILWPGNNKCIAKVIITCKDSDGNNLSEQSLLDINQSYIEVSATSATKSFLLPKGTTQLVYEVHGKSQKNWGGQYGPRFWGMYVGFIDLTKTYTASAVASLGDSLVFSQTDGIKALDTLTVASKYSDVRIKSISSESSSVISSNQAMCIGADMTINAEFYRRHSIVASSSEYGTITIKKDIALYGDTITVSHTMNSDTVRFAGYTTTPNVNWLNDSTFIMVDEDVTIGMEVYRKHSIVATSEYGTITIKKNSALCGDTITVSHTMNTDTVRFAGYTTTPDINWLNDSTFIMVDEDVTIGMKVYRKHSVVASASEYGTITVNRDAALCGDTITVSHAMNSDTVLFAGYTTTPDINWLNDSTFIMVDEDVTIGMGIYRKHSIVVSASEYGTITIKKDTAFCGDTITVSHAMNSDTVRLAGYITTPDLTWLNDSTFIMLDEDVTIGMGIYRKHSIVVSASEYGTITIKKDTAFCGDTITVSLAMNSDTVRLAGYITTPDLTWLNDSTFIMVDEDVTIGMGIYRKHSIVAFASEYGTIALKKDTAFCGDTITVSLALNTGFALGGYATTPDLKWLNDSTFIMVDEDVSIGIKASNIHDIPFCDDFENGNTQDQNIVGWLQQSEYGIYSWTANSTFTGYNCTPYSGSWNATLFWRNTCWLFTPVNLVKGTKYVFSIYARQSSRVASASYAKISAKIGTAADKDSMKQVVVAETGIVDGDYQRIESSFIAGTSGVCWLGIRGYVDFSHSYYLSIDSVSLVKFGLPITIVESENGSVAIANGPAQEDDVVKLAITPEVGYTLDEITILQNGDKVVFNAEDSTFVMPADSVEISATFRKDDYAILVNESENGMVTSNATAQMDDIVKLAIIPTIGYTLDEITISQNGDKVVFNSEDSTFIMLAGDVEISATFKKIDYNITIDETKNGAVIASATAQMDDVVKLAIIPTIGYTLDEITISQNGDKLAFNAEDSTFVMLAGNVEISATFKKIDYSILVHESENGTVTTNATAQMDDVVKLAITPAIGYTLDKITITQNGDMLTFNTEDSTFVMPADSVEISATFTKVDYTILVKESENGTVTSSDDIAQIDDVVKLNITSAVGYTLDEIIISQNGDMVTFNAEDSTFVMPGGNVEISATFKKIDYSIYVVEPENGSVQVNATAQMDDFVELSISPASGYIVDEISISHNGEAVEYNAKFGLFVMPAGDVTITATFKQSTDVEDVKVLNLYVADGRIYCEGEFRIYDLLGRDVTEMNGSLRGVYIVRTKDAFRKVIVK